MAEAGSHHLGAGVRAQASRQQPGLWGRGELQDQGQGPLGTAGATPEEAFYAYNGSWEMFRTDQSLLHINSMISSIQMQTPQK